MSFSLQHYVELVEEYKEQADRLVTIFTEMENPVKIEKILLYKNELQKDNFQITVVGEFGRGKSLFINALLGEKILPSSPLVTTTVLNHITYGEQPEIVLHFHEKKVKDETISGEEFQQIVAPQEPLPGDEAGQKKYEEAVKYIESIAYADVKYPISFCKDGVRLIDTPGLNDGNATRDRLASEIIPRSDAAILLLTAKSPLSATEMVMLKDRLLKNDIQKVFIVVNFKDALRTPEDEREVLDYIRANLQGIIDQPKLYLLSAKHGLIAKRMLNEKDFKPRKPIALEETGIMEFEHALAGFLQYDRGKVKLTRPLQQTIRLVDETLDKDIRIARQSMEMKVEGLEEKIKQVHIQLENFKKSGEKSFREIRSLLQVKGKELTKWYEDEMVHIKHAGLQAFDRQYSLDESTIANAVESAIAPLERQLQEAKIKRMQSLAKQIIKMGSKKLNEKWKQIDTDFHQLIQLEETNLMKVSDTERREVDLFHDIYDQLDIAWHRSTLLLPGGIFVFALVSIFYGIGSFLKGLFGISEEEKRRRMRDKLSRQLSANQSQKVAAFKKEWKAVLDGIETQYKQTINQAVQEKENQLSTVVNNAQLEKNEIQNHLAAIQEKEIALQQIKRECFQIIERLNVPTKEGAGV